MSGRTAELLCDCGFCRRSKARMRQRYRRNRNRGFRLPEAVCECGTCHKCHERARVQRWRDERKAMVERGETPPKSAREILIEAKRAQLKAWRAARKAEAEARAALRALNQKQKAEIRMMIWEALELTSG